MKGRIRLLSVVGLTGWLAAAAVAQPTLPYDGVVTGDNVYVRSFNDTNSYPTTQLSSGDPVRVVGQRGEWLQIEPPEGSFCWIETARVDHQPGADTGTVNADNVYVRIGSTMERWSRDRSMIATQLNRGAQVHILGESSDGFYSITPPEMAYLWIYGDYVRPAGEPAEVVEAPTTPEEAEPAIASEELTADEPPAAAPPRRQYAMRLEQIETELDAERVRPLLDQRLDMFIERLEPIAAQDTEKIAQAKAMSYLEHLRLQRDAQKILQRSRQIIRESAAESEKEQERRMAIALARRVRGPFQVRGELRKSWLGDVPNQPVRYRLVDPFKERTVAYLLFEPDSPLKPEKHLGRFLGVYGRRVSDHPDWLVDAFMAEELVELPTPLSPAEVSEPIMAPPVQAKPTPTEEPAEDEAAEAESAE